MEKSMRIRCYIAKKRELREDKSEEKEGRKKER
jgi:hypothetical protein